MSEFYQICTSICVVIAVGLAIGLWITFEPIGSLVGQIKKRVPEYRIRRARKTIERYNVDRVLSDAERSAIVLEYLQDHGMLLVSRRK